MQWAALLAVPSSESSLFAVIRCDSSRNGIQCQLVDASNGKVWATTNTISSHCPSFLQPAAHLQLLSEGLCRKNPDASFDVFPFPATPNTSLVRLDVKVSATSGKATVVVASFSCSALQVSPGLLPLASVFQGVGSYLKVVEESNEKLHQASSELALLQGRVDDFTLKAARREEDVLRSFVTILNEKKRRIRELLEEVESLKRKKMMDDAVKQEVECVSERTDESSLEADEEERPEHTSAATALPLADTLAMQEQPLHSPLGEKRPRNSLEDLLEL